MSRELPHILIPVFFHAPMGGLQSNVRAQALAIQRAGWSCTVLCKPGPFAEQLTGDGVRVLPDDYADVGACAQRAIEAGPYDLVHAHPFTSRRVGLDVAGRLGLPLLLTIHGMYDDELGTYADGVDRVLCVSPAIRDSLVARHPDLAERVLVMPNAVDREVFAPGAAERTERLSRLAASVGEVVDPALRHVLFVSRLDHDKKFILDVVRDTWTRQREALALDLRWWIAGDGKDRGAVEDAAAALNEAAGAQRVSFLGWQPEPRLAALYGGADLSVAPGRSALDCLACGRPVIAVGSKAYLGLMDQRGVLRGQYTNYGGFGGGAREYTAGRMLGDLEQVIYDDARLDALGAFGCSFVTREHDQRILDERLLDLYRASLAWRRDSGSAYSAHFRLADLPGLAFGAVDSADTLAPHWRLGAVPSGEVKPDRRGHLAIRYACGPEEKFYLSNGGLDFASPGEGAGLWRVRGNAHYRLRATWKVQQGAPEALLWVIEYDATARLKHVTTPLRAGVVELPFSTSESTESIRVAIRFAGAGEATLAPMELFEPEPELEPERVQPAVRQATGRRELDPVAYASFTGGSVVIVLGPPRSGTTWLLKLLSEHPGVVAADVDNLGARTNDSPTLETNVFNPQRPFSDPQIRHMFHRLASAHPGKAVVEKTPIHLLHVDRILRIFPDAALVLIERDGRDVVSSLVHVGRDPNAWWKGAPSTVREAARLWNTYSEAARRCQELYAPYSLRYEDLLRDPEGEVAALLSWLGLSTEPAPDLVAASRAGRNIPIKGVFRKGTVGGWRELFTPEDVTDFVAEAGGELRRLGYVDSDGWGG